MQERGVTLDAKRWNEVLPETKERPPQTRAQAILADLVDQRIRTDALYKASHSLDECVLMCGLV